MFTNFSLKHKVYLLWTGCWSVYITALFIISTFLVGCTSVSSNRRRLPPDIDRRHPADIQLGAKLILFEEPPIGSNSLIDMDGVAHVFLIDRDQQLIHIKVLGDQIITREILGTTNAMQAGKLDSVEHPRGKIRVLAGDKQYFRNTPNLEWQKIEGNSCAQFVPAGNDLFCAFVINGNEISAFEERHYTYGWFILVPIFFWTYEYSSKLVLAQESQSGWIIRAVVDPDTSSDTANEFMVGTDNLGSLHFLYFTSKSSDWFYFITGAAEAGGGGSAWDSGSSLKSEIRYAKLRIDQLLAHPTEAQNQASNQATNPEKWLAIKGASLQHPPFIKDFFLKENYTERVKFRPLNSDFWVNKMTGEVGGLLWVRDITLVDDGQQLDFFKLAPSLVEISIRDGYWSPDIDIVAAEDSKNGIPPWSSAIILSIKADNKGNRHMLLVCSDPKYGDRLSMNYLLRNDANWSAPLSLGSSSLKNYFSTLAVDDSGGIAFAAWVNEEGKFIGRWIKPSRIGLD